MLSLLHHMNTNRTAHSKTPAVHEHGAGCACWHDWTRARSAARTTEGARTCRPSWELRRLASATLGVLPLLWSVVRPSRSPGFRMTCSSLRPSSLRPANSAEKLGIVGSAEASGDAATKELTAAVCASHGALACGGPGCWDPGVMDPFYP